MVVKMVQIMTKEIYKKKRLVLFSSCYKYGILQAIYQRWKQKDKQGWFQKVKGVRCQYQGVVIPVVTVIWSKRDCTDKNIVGQ